jgi:hypothetical protein
MTRLYGAVRLIIGCALVGCSAGAPADSTAMTNGQVAEYLQARFPNTPIDKVSEGPAPGIVEVIAGANLYYFLPDQKLVLFGEFFTIDGQSVTGARLQDMNLGETPAAAWNPAEAVVVRPGPVPVTAFLDVDCGHCRRSVHWILDQNGLPDAGLNVVFVSRTREQADRAVHVLCAPPHLREAALQQVFARGEGELLSCDEGERLAQLHARIAADLGVSATPVFAVGETVVTGFNRDRLLKLVSGKTP